MQVTQTLEQLKHVALDLGFGELDVWVGGHSGKIMVHVRSDHVESGSLLAFLLSFVSVGDDWTERVTYSCSAQPPSRPGEEC